MENVMGQYHTGQQKNAPSLDMDTCPQRSQMGPEELQPDISNLGKKSASETWGLGYTPELCALKIRWKQGRLEKADLRSVKNATKYRSYS